MKQRVLSGMRPTGALHLGHYHGALKNWVRLQADFDCFYFVADWHALTTHYEDREVIEKNVYDMVIDWIAAGLDPEQCTIFIQSRLPEHAELFTLLAMGTPLGWLERMPTYKDQIEKLKDKDLAGAAYTDKGFYVRLRYKFDETLFDWNKDAKLRNGAAATTPSGAAPAPAWRIPTTAAKSKTPPGGCCEFRRVRARPSC